MATLLRVPQVKVSDDQSYAVPPSKGDSKRSAGTLYSLSAGAPIATLTYGARVVDMKPAHGDDPGDYPNPRYVFLIYMTQVGTKKWAARHMYAPVISTAENTADILYDLAKVDDKNTPWRVGNSFVNLVWSGPCYFYLVLDFDHAEFISPTAPEFDPMIFHARKPVLGSHPPIYLNYDANHSFYNGTITSVRGRSAFRCINYFKDESGNELKYPQTRSYGFEIRFVVTYEDGTRRAHDIDPDGQNQGPPVVPLELDIRAA